jgi:hypothetical protein
MPFLGQFLAEAVKSVSQEESARTKPEASQKDFRPAWVRFGGAALRG